MDFKEIFKLKEMLEKANIPYEMSWDIPNHMVLKYPSCGKWKLSIAIGPMTYGYPAGLLETWNGGQKKGPRGWQTAEQAFAEILSIKESNAQKA